jgi:hypothetical protein
VIPCLAACGQKAKGQSAYRNEWDKPFHPDRLDDLDTSHDQPWIAQQATGRGAGPFRGTSLDFTAAGGMDANEDQCDQEEKASGSQASLDQSVMIAHRDKARSDQEGNCDAKADRRDRSQRGLAHGRSGRTLDVVDHALKHRTVSLKL